MSDRLFLKTLNIIRIFEKFLYKFYDNFKQILYKDYVQTQYMTYNIHSNTTGELIHSLYGLFFNSKIKFPPDAFSYYRIDINIFEVQLIKCIFIKRNIKI